MVRLGGRISRSSIVMPGKSLTELQLLKIWAINSYFHVISICILAPHYLLLSICFKALFKTRFWLWKNLYFRKSVVGTICCFFWHCCFTFLFLSQDWSCCLLTLLWAGYTSYLAVGFRSIQVDTAGLELCFGFFFFLDNCQFWTSNLNFKFAQTDQHRETFRRKKNKFLAWSSSFDKITSSLSSPSYLPEPGACEVLILSFICPSFLCCQAKVTQRGIHEYICLSPKWRWH